MDIDLVYTIITIALPIIVGFIVYFVQGKSIKKAQESYEYVKQELINREDTIKGIIKFFDPEMPKSDISDDALDVIIGHPKSYRLESSAKALIFEDLPEDEIAKLEEIINNYELEMNTDYNLYTSVCNWRIYYGVPTEITLRD